MIFFLLLLLLVPVQASADIIWMSGFEAPGNATGTAKDSVEVTDTGTDTSTVEQSTVVHDNTNGGHSASNWAYKITAASGAEAYITPKNLALNHEQISTSFFVYYNTFPGSVSTDCREVVRMEDSSNNTLCNIQICQNGDMKLRYGSTAITPSINLAEDDTCSIDDHIRCTDSTDCSQNPATQTCTACNASTGADCYWAGVEMVFSNTSCRMLLNGKLIAKNDAVSPQMSNVDEIKLGALGTNTHTGSGIWYMDDWVISDSNRAHYGWVAPLLPDVVDTSISQCVEGADCNGGGQSAVLCIDDWLSGGSLDVTTASTNKCRNPGTTSDCTTGDGDAFTTVDINMEGRATKIPAVAVAAYGKTTSAASGYKTTVGVGVGDISATQNWSFDTTGIALSSCDAGCLMGYATWNEVPPDGASTWLDQMDNIMIRYRSCAEAGSGGESNRVAAILGYAFGEYPDTSLLPANIPDVNGDGLIVEANIGDSILSGVASRECLLLVSGETVKRQCSQETSCSWSEFDDAPLGGCEVNADCRTCTLTRDDLTGDAGVLCDDVTYLCDSGTQTCNTSEEPNVCNNNANIQCTTADLDTNGKADDCENLGSCPSAVSVTCDDNCPGTGNTCPIANVGWGVYTADHIKADVVINYGRGGETSHQMVERRAYDILRGQHNTGFFVKGTGVCGCDDNTDCNPGGTCNTSTHKCTASSDPNILACTDALGCAEDTAGVFDTTYLPNFPCMAPGYPDTGTVYMGANDYDAPDPNCDRPRLAQEPLANRYNVCELTAASRCPSTPTTCMYDGDCSANGPDSICLGKSLYPAGATINTPCIVSNGGSKLGCTAFSFDCTDVDVCATFSMGTCTQATTTPTDYGYGKICVPANDADCTDLGIGLHKGGNLCRSECTAATAAADCGTGASCLDITDGTACVDPGDTCVCGGYCTCPCSAESCTDSCLVRTIPNSGVDPKGFVPPEIKVQGKCVSGSCQECGWEFHPSGTGWAKNVNEGAVRGSQLYEAYRSFQAQAEDLADPPLFVFGIPPPPRTTDAFNTNEYQDQCGASIKGDTTNLPYVANLKECEYEVGYANRYNSYVENIHRNSLGGTLLMDCFADILESFNTCTTGSRDTLAPQKYCLAENGDYSNACTDNDDCTTAETCSIKPCYCTVNGDCAGKGASGVDGTCNTGTHECEYDPGGGSVSVCLGSDTCNIVQ